MAVIEHPMMGNQGSKDLSVEPTKPLKDTVILSAEDEAMIARTLQAESLPPDVESIVSQKMEKDPIVALEAQKRQALEDVLFFGKPHLRKISIGKSIFTFKLMNGIEGDEVIERLSKLNNLHQVSKASRMTLANTLVSVNDIALEEFYDGKETGIDALTKRYHVITKWPAPLINKLYKAYEQILTEFDSQFPIDFLDLPQTNRTTV